MSDFDFDFDFDEELPEEPYYVDFEDEVEKEPPKWKSPKTPLGEKALAACGRKYFKDKKEGSKWRMIEKCSLPLASGIDSVYPKEWIEQMIDWAKTRNHFRVIIVFPALMKSIKNEAAITDFKAKWRKENRLDVQIQRRRLTGNEEKIEW